MTGVTVKAKANGEIITIKAQCPSCYAEMSVGQYIRVYREWEDGSDIADRDYFKLFNILTDGKFSGYEKTIENEISLMNMIGWVITEPVEFSKELPKVLAYKGQIIDIPREPRELSIGQNIQLRRYVEKTSKLEENIAIATAIYLQPIIEKSLFKLPNAEGIAKEIEKMPINVIYPIGFFLLKRSLTFGMRPEKTLSLIKISPKQIFAQMFRDLRKFIS